MSDEIQVSISGLCFNVTARDDWDEESPNNDELIGQVLSMAMAMAAIHVHDVMMVMASAIDSLAEFVPDGPYVEPEVDVFIEAARRYMRAKLASRDKAYKQLRELPQSREDGNDNLAH